MLRSFGTATFKCTGGPRTCKYHYEGAARGPQFNIDRTVPFAEATEWAHSFHKVPRQWYFDQCVANVYDRNEDQYIPFHTDQNPLLGKTSDIVSLTMGAATAFCYGPRDDGSLRQTGRLKLDRDQYARVNGLMGCVALLPGDRFLASGMFQKY